MTKADKKYLLLIAGHCFLGFLIYLFQSLAILYFLGCIAWFGIQVFKNGNRNNEVLIAAAYITGGEDFFRMTKSTIAYESGKYVVIIFVILGLFFSGTSRKSWPYLIYLLLFIPGVLYASVTLGYDVNYRKAMFFNLAGPFCLGIAALYCMDRKVNYKQLGAIFLHLLLPVISMAVYLLFYTPDTREVLNGTASNFATSGGFGPNQVSTALGIGVFGLVIRLIGYSKNKIVLLVNILLIALLSYRAIVTFSRGGVVTSVIISFIFVFFYFQKSNARSKSRISVYFLILLVIGLFSWTLSFSRTEGLIGNRYANKDATGRIKEDLTTGRGVLIKSELNAFIDNPILGVGVGKAKEYRKETTGLVIASHNEVSRTLSEHGIFGLLAIGILLVYPFFFRLYNRKSVFFYSALAFWFLTINHSSMRIAAPAFIYALCLLNVVNEKKKTLVHRQRAIA